MLPSANNYPHAPWWEAPPEPPPSINPTGPIVSVLTKRSVAHPWAERGAEFCWRSLEHEQPAGFDDLRCAIAFLEQAKDRDRAAARLTRMHDYLFSSKEMEFDLSAPGYVHPPLDWAPAPIGFGHSLFARDQLIEGLAALAKAQRDDGGWPIKWPAISPGVELEWRGRVTIDALLTLRAYEIANRRRSRHPQKRFGRYSRCREAIRPCRRSVRRVPGDAGARPCSGPPISEDRCYGVLAFRTTAPD